MNFFWIILAIFVLAPLAGGIAKRIGEAPSQDVRKRLEETERRLEEARRRLTEAEQRLGITDDRVADMEQRFDFFERLLKEGDEARRLPSGGE